jgi:hypothetical protein
MWVRQDFQTYVRGLNYFPVVTIPDNPDISNDSESQVNNPILQAIAEVKRRKREAQGNQDDGDSDTDPEDQLLRTSGWMRKTRWLKIFPKSERKTLLEAVEMTNHRDIKCKMDDPILWRLKKSMSRIYSLKEADRK